MTDVQHERATLTVTRAEVEDFFYYEAALLDEWRLEEWLDLFTEDAVYEIPATDLPGHIESNTSRTYALVYERRTLLEQRVIRLKKPTAHAEFPHSRTRRLLTNVRILGAVFYVGRYEYVLRRGSDGLKIRHRKAVLDQATLDPHGKISIIL
jgi:p-cumate 2,3-dioxygenase subunit beta